MMNKRLLLRIALAHIVENIVCTSKTTSRVVNKDITTKGFRFDGIVGNKHSGQRIPIWP